MFFRSPSVVLLALLFTASIASGQQSPLRVCADPDNLPFSNAHGEGFENRIAQMVGSYMGEDVEFVWQRMGRGFVREYIDKGKCDLVIGIPSAFRPLLTTQPYYRSSFFFLTRRSAKFHPSSLDDPQLKSIRIGVEALEEEYTPPAQGLARRGLQAQLVGIYSVGSHSFDIAKAVSDGDVGIGIMWGPTAGYLAKRSPDKFFLSPVQPQADGPLPFTFAIAMGVSKANRRLQARLDEFIASNRANLQKLLDSYGVPQLAINEAVSKDSR
jgi:mxaJ protein